jgi:hypothetical protein
MSWFGNYWQSGGKQHSRVERGAGGESYIRIVDEQKVECL